MTEEKIKRINALAKKEKSEGLSAEERAEQQILRQEYLAAIRQSLDQALDHTYVQQPDGTVQKLRHKPFERMN